MTKQTIQFKVLRHKQGQAAPSYQIFSAEVGPRTTVLDVLLGLRRDKDPSLMIRHSCLHASCGTCGMKVNNVEVLGCVTNVLELKTSMVVVEPMDNLPLVGDLVVDMADFYHYYDQAEMPYIRESEHLAASQVPEGFEQHSRMENCLECGCCVSACPVVGTDPKYLGPAALAAAWRVIEEPRGGDVEAILDWVDQEHGCWRCHAVFECSEVCPSNVDPAGGIMALRRELTKRKIRGLFGLR